MLQEDRIGEVLHDEADGDAAARQLVDEANEAGGADNITVLIVDIEDDGEPDVEPPAESSADAPSPSGIEDESLVDDSVTPPHAALDEGPEAADGAGRTRGLFGRRKKK
jgi:hypothetical protein